MALDTSKNGYEDVYEKSGPENSCKYYEGYLEKKEKLSKWTSYWCVLKKQDIFFFKDVNTQIKENYVGFFHLENGTKVEIIKSKEKKYEWVIKTKHSKITLKTHIENLRTGWVDAMEMSLKHEKPSTQSYILPGSGPASPTRQVQPTSSSPEKTTNSPSSMPTGDNRKPSLRYNEIDPDQLASLRKLDMMNHSSDSISEEMSDLRVMADDVLSTSEHWFQPNCVRDEADTILQREVRGTFIVRDHHDASSQKKTGYVISLKDHENKTRHHRVEKRGDILIIKGYEMRSFDTLHDLLRYFILSQRKKIQLVPYNPNKPRSPVHEGYENTQAKSSPKRSQRQLPTPPLRPVGDQGYEKMDGRATPSPHTPARACSFQHRRLPQPPPPSSGMGRSNSEYRHQNRFPPSPYLNEFISPSISPATESYMEMTVSSSEGTPMNGTSYENLQPSQHLASSRNTNDPHVPVNNASYENIPPPPLPPPRANGNVGQQHSYINLQAQHVRPQDEPAPRLPPKKRASSLRESGNSYGNCQVQG